MFGVILLISHYFIHYYSHSRDSGRAGPDFRVSLSFITIIKHFSFLEVTTHKDRTISVFHQVGWLFFDLFRFALSRSLFALSLLLSHSTVAFDLARSASLEAGILRFFFSMRCGVFFVSGYAMLCCADRGCGWMMAELGKSTRGLEMSC